MEQELRVPVMEQELRVPVMEQELRVPVMEQELRVPVTEQEQLTLPKHMFTSVFNGTKVAKIAVFCVLFCQTLFCPFIHNL
jgi:hypothetical protein